jgi:putative alpha-1,2-mannosidase
MYIQSARLNGQPHKRFWFMHDELIRGGTLEIELGPVPNREWGIIGNLPELTSTPDE